MAQTKMNINRNIEVKSTKPDFEQLRKRDAQLVRGRFNFSEIPGGILSFPYKKYKGDKIIQYKLKDGEVYKIPRGVAKHLATSGSYPIHEYSTDSKGTPLVRIGRMKKRYSFESLEFFDDLDIKESGLYTVEKL